MTFSVTKVIILKEVMSVTFCCQHWYKRCINRDCGKSGLVKDFATFHIFFDFDHIPDQVNDISIISSTHMSPELQNVNSFTRSKIF